MQEIAAIAVAIAVAISVGPVFLALMYIAYQLREISPNLRRQMYLDTLDRYTDLRVMALNDSDLRVIYRVICVAEISRKQRLYIYLLIAFCEGLYLTKQINLFENVIGGNWENFIRHTLSTPAVRVVWDEEARCPRESDYADDFIAYASQLLI